jgi:hypothetical protein
MPYDLREAPVDLCDSVARTHPKLSLPGATAPGRYRVTVTYRFDRAAYLRRCAGACDGHRNADARWNRAFDFPLRAEAEFEVK